MATGDFYKVSLFYGHDPNNPYSNVFWYEQTAGVIASAINLVASFQVTVLAPLAGIIAPEVTFYRVLVQNYQTPADNAEDVTPTPGVGGATNPAVPDTLAFSWRSARPDLSKRYSYKRFAGVALAILAGRTFNVAAAGVPAVTTALGAIINPGTNTWKPIQVKTLVNPTTGVVTITKNYDIQSYTPIAKATTQDSRKR